MSFSLAGGDFQDANQLMILVSIGMGFVAVTPLPTLGAPVGRFLALRNGLVFILREVHLRRMDNRGINHLATLGHESGCIKLPLHVSK